MALSTATLKLLMADDWVGARTGGMATAGELAEYPLLVFVTLIGNACAAPVWDVLWFIKEGSHRGYRRGLA